MVFDYDAVFFRIILFPFYCNIIFVYILPLHEINSGWTAGYSSWIMSAWIYNGNFTH